MLCPPLWHCWRRAYSELKLLASLRCFFKDSISLAPHSTSGMCSLSSCTPNCAKGLRSTVFFPHATEPPLLLLTPSLPLKSQWGLPLLSVLSGVEARSQGKHQGHREDSRGLGEKHLMATAGGHAEAWRSCSTHFSSERREGLCGRQSTYSPLLPIAPSFQPPMPLDTLSVLGQAREEGPPEQVQARVSKSTAGRGFRQ